MEPRPELGFQFHSVLVVHSAHLASISSPAEHRWLPIFWALDYYKGAAAQDVEERGDWVLSAPRESALPSSTQAAAAFRTAMDQWDVEAADAAMTVLARTAGAGEIYEMLVRYGARDYRTLGHKAIYVANGWRTLQCIGWRHAEPVLRSLAYALLMHEDANPAQRDDPRDLPFRRNMDLVRRVRPGWLDGANDPGATRSLVEAWRNATPDEACDAVVEALNRGVHPGSVWDALHLGASELLMRKPEIVALHAVTTTNALYFAYLTAAEQETRLLVLLQNAAFLPMFRKSMGPNRVKDLSITGMQPQKPGTHGAKAVEEIFARLKADPKAAASQALGYLNETGQARDLIDMARMLVFTKGTDPHDYKFSSAILEDYHHLSPALRNTYLAANLFYLRGSAEPDNTLVQRTRQALG